MEYQIEAKRRIRLGIVGAGSHAYRNILPTLIYLPVDLVAVADVDADRAAAVAKVFGAKNSYSSAAEMYAKEDLEAVLLVVSPQLHPRLAIEAFQAGLHVYMEKPAGTRARFVEDMLAARGDRISVVGHKKCFMPATRKAAQLLADPANQPIQTLLGVYPNTVPEGGMAVLEAGEKTPWLANGCHPLSILLELGGAVDEVVYHRSKHGGGVAVMSNANGSITTLHLPYGAPSSQPVERYLISAGKHSIEVVNSRKVVYQRGIDFNYGHGTDYTDGEGAVVWEAQNHLNSPENTAVMTQGLFGGLEHFFQSILNGTPATTSNLEFTLELTRVWEAIQLSDGKSIRIADI
jgi:predicted dehydrogenase